MLFRLLTALPKARRWVNQTLAAHEDHMRPVTELRLKRISCFFPKAFLDGVRVVVVDRVPHPRLEDLGIDLGEERRSDVMRDPLGIALRNVFFLRSGHEADESLCFHELVHVAQWQQLGVNGFLAMYGLSWMQVGYAANPLEVMAYDLQNRFDGAQRPFFAIPVIQQQVSEMLEQFKHRSVVNRGLLALAQCWRG